MRTATLGILALVGILVVLGSNALYTVFETEQVIITQFGEPVGIAVSEPGLHFKIPFIQRVNRFEKRFLEWDGDPNQIPTRDKRFIWVDTMARWHITDPLLFFQRLRDEMGAQSRLDDILDGETRNTIAKHDLIEIVRSSEGDAALVGSTRDVPDGDSGEGGPAPATDGETLAAEPRESSESEAGEEAAAEPKVDAAPVVMRYGREQLAQEVLLSASEAVLDLGIEILDVRFKRINYQEEVRREVYTRMISERKRIAEEYRSEGQGEAARISGERVRQLKVITSEAYREAREIEGRADAKAADIYAEAYNQNPEFYAFLQSMELYPESLDKETELLLSTDSEFLGYISRAK